MAVSVLCRDDTFYAPRDVISCDKYSINDESGRDVREKALVRRKIEQKNPNLLVNHAVSFSVSRLSLSQCSTECYRYVLTMSSIAPTEDLERLPPTFAFAFHSVEN